MRKSLKLQRVKRIKHSPPGTSPGVIKVSDEALKLKVRSFAYDQDIVLETELHNIDEIKSQLQNNPDTGAALPLNMPELFRNIVIFPFV